MEQKTIPLLFLCFEFSAYCTNWTHLQRVHAFDGFSKLLGGLEENVLCWGQFFYSCLQLIHLRRKVSYEQTEQISWKVSTERKHSRFMPIYSVNALSLLCVLRLK